MNFSLFDQTAKQFAHSTDQLVEAGRYVRGQMFLSALQSHVQKSGSVLDYGCGPGRIASLVAATGLSVLGVDGSEAMLAEARRHCRNYSNAKFGSVAETTEWLRPGCYDAVVCSSTIEYVEQPITLLRTFKEVLKTDGVLVITYANKYSLWRMHARLIAAPNAPHYKLQHNIWSWRRFRSTLDKAGFRVIDGPSFLEASGFDKRKWLRWLTPMPFIGTLGFAVARPKLPAGDE